MAEITDEQRDILKHAVGAGSKTLAPGWRNHYCQSPDNPDCLALVEAGLMKLGRTINNGASQYFIVTDAGFDAIGIKETERYVEEGYCGLQ